MNNGNYDNIHDCKYRIPDYWDIGEVYERLIEDCFSDDEILHGIWKVYHSWISDKISNYNTDFIISHETTLQLVMRKEMSCKWE